MNTADQIDAESQKDPARLEREIDQQRDDIGNIVEALENKLSPGQMFDRLVDFGKGNGREFAQNLTGTVKAHPVPTLLASVGLLWLYAARNDTRPAMGRGLYTGSTAGGGASGLKQKASEVGDQLADTWDSARSRVGEAGDRVHDAAARIGDSVQVATQTVREQTQRARQGFNTMLDDNPLALGAIGVALGALLGAALPVTAQEDRLLGPASDRVADKARQAAHSVADEARDTLQQATDTTPASQHGSEPGSGRFH